MAGSPLSIPSPDIQEAIALRDLAADAAMRVGTYLRQSFGAGMAIEHKGAIDLVTEADRAAETLAIDTIRAARPGDAVLAEERGADGDRVARVRWIIDPLDGTTNFARSLPWFGVSIAAEVAGQLAAGAIHVPMVDELFTVARGAGAMLNGRPIAVSAVPRLAGAFLATGFPYDIRENPDNNLDHFAPLLHPGAGDPPSGRGGDRSRLCRVRAFRRLLGAPAQAVGRRRRAASSSSRPAGGSPGSTAVRAGFTPRGSAPRTGSCTRRCSPCSRCATSRHRDPLN